MIDNKIDLVVAYLENTVELSDTEINIIKTAINLISEISPTDITVIFSKLDNIIETSNNLGYVIYYCNQYKINLTRKYRNLKDPAFTSLTLKQRPSTLAIESEIRTKYPEIAELEYQVETITNAIDYLNHIELNLERRIWSIKDRLQMSKI